MTREAQLWDYLRKSCFPPGTHLSRIESETAPGFPDVHYTYAGSSGTIELKSSKSPVPTIPFTQKRGLRQSQLEWIADECEAGGNVWVCLKCGPTIYLIKGSKAKFINGATESDLKVFSSYYWTVGQNPKTIRKNLGIIL